MKNFLFILISLLTVSVFMFGCATLPKTCGDGICSTDLGENSYCPADCGTANPMNTLNPSQSGVVSPSASTSYSPSASPSIDPNFNKNYCFLDLKFNETTIYSAGEMVELVLDDASKDNYAYQSSSTTSSVFMELDPSQSYSVQIISGPVINGGTNWYKVAFFNSNGADLGEGWVVEEMISPNYDTKAKFTLQKAEAIYGDYSRLVNQLFNNPGTLTVELYLNGRAILNSKYAAYSSRIMYADAFDEEGNPLRGSGMQLLNSGTMEVIVPNTTVPDQVKIFDGSVTLATISLNKYSIQCKRTCAGLNETMNLAARQECCPTLVPTISQTTRKWICVKEN